MFEKLRALIGKLTGCGQAPEQQSLDGGPGSASSRIREEALSREAKKLIAALKSVPAEIQKCSWKAPVFETLKKQDLPPALRESPAVKTQFASTFTGLIESRHAHQAFELLNRFLPEDAERRALIMRTFEGEIAKPGLGEGQCLIQRGELSIEDVLPKVVNAIYNRKQSADLLAVASWVDDCKRSDRSIPWGTKFEIEESLRPAFRSLCHDLLSSPKASTAAGFYDLTSHFDCYFLSKDLSVRKAALQAVATVLKSDVTYLVSGLIVFFNVTQDELRDAAVQEAVLVSVENHCAKGALEEANSTTAAFQPRHEDLEKAVIRGVRRLQENGYSGWSALRTMQIASTTGFSEATLASPECQKLAVHALVSAYCHHRYVNSNDEVPYDLDEMLLGTLKPAPESLEEAALTAAGRIYGCLVDSCFDIRLINRPADAVLLDRSETGKLRFFPPFLRHFVEVYDICTFEELERFRSANYYLLLKFQGRPEAMPKTTAADIPAMRTLHISPLTAEELRESSVDLNGLAEERDFTGLWQEMMQHCNHHPDIETFEKAAALFGYERMFRHMRQLELHGYRDGLNRYEEVVQLAAVSGLTPDLFYSRIIEPIFSDRAVYNDGDSSQSGFDFFHHTVLQTAQLPAIISEYPDGRLPTHIRMVTDRLVAEFPEKTDIFQSWESFKTFVSRYHAVFQAIHQGEDRPYSNPPMAGISIYEANGIKPDDMVY